MYVYIYIYIYIHTRIHTHVKQTSSDSEMFWLCPGPPLRVSRRPGGLEQPRKTKTSNNNKQVIAYQTNNLTHNNTLIIKPYIELKHNYSLRNNTIYLSNDNMTPNT